MPRSSSLLLSFSLLAGLAAGCKDPSPTFVFDAGTPTASDASDARLDAGADVSLADDAASDVSDADADDAEGGATP